MVSGPDIITYIGVPLAVLGVMPIIYNTVITLVTLAKVRRMLRHGRLAGIARGDVVNHVIEVELPRYTIAPLHREEQCKEYWRLCDYPSTIPGGTWTTFNWKRHHTGLKTQRIDYSDQLRQPQAEIEFEELVSFLLDLGAVPDATGFRMLRGSGLWVPTGTPLLVSPDRQEPVLTIAPLDDSDGRLSLAVRWSSNWGMRNHTSLPPYWVLITGTLPERPSTSSSPAEKQHTEDEGPPSKPSVDKRNSTSKYIPIPEEYPPAIRCQIGINGLITAIPNDFEAQMFDQLNCTHLQADDHQTNTTGIWFASAITAFSTNSNTILWNYKIPTSLLLFSQAPSIPCGILVLLSIVPESETPEWATKHNDEEDDRENQMRKVREQGRQMIKENALQGEERNKAVRERQIRNHEEWVQELNAKRRRDIQRKEQREIEAVQSPKWENKLVAEHNLSWLKAQGHVHQTHNIKRAVEILLWKMVTDPGFAEDLVGMLDKWKAFVDNGGLRKADYLVLKENQELFAYATLLVAVIKGSVTTVHGSLAMDLQECMRIWKKVRLG